MFSTKAIFGMLVVSWQLPYCIFCIKIVFWSHLATATYFLNHHKQVAKLRSSYDIFDCYFFNPLNEMVILDDWHFFFPKWQRQVGHLWICPIEIHFKAVGKRNKVMPFCHMVYLSQWEPSIEMLLPVLEEINNNKSAMFGLSLATFVVLIQISELVPRHNVCQRLEI